MILYQDRAASRYGNNTGVRVIHFSICASPDEIVGSDCINLTRQKPDSVVTERDLGFGQMVQSRPWSWQVREGYLGRGCA